MHLSTLRWLVAAFALCCVVACMGCPSSEECRKYCDFRVNEAVAANMMRSMCHSEEHFKLNEYQDANTDGIGDYGTLAQLANPKSDGSETGFIPVPLGDAVMYGYVFTSIVTAGSDTVAGGYSVTAIPEEAGVTGRYRFYIDNTITATESTDDWVKYSDCDTWPTADSPSYEFDD